MLKNASTLHRLIVSLVLIIGFGLSSGCASTSGPEDNDPFEGYNRAMTKFNLKLDDYVVAPVARGYKNVVPSPVRNGVDNFFSNLREPLNVVYDLLQGKFRMAGRDAGRFLINTTLGFAGLNDVASHMDLTERREDFGQVLGTWGVGSGPHLVLPFIGPSNIRDAVGLVPGFMYADEIALKDPEQTYATVVRLIDIRSQLLGTEEVLALQPDKYLFLRETYRQRREAQINDRSRSEPDISDDELLDELLEDN
ncbi:MAG: MlaA family lipoprotein [Gammaproteobacteria bacterium]